MRLQELERESLEEGDIAQAEIFSNKVSDLREKTIILKSLIIIEENEKEVRLISSST